MDHFIDLQNTLERPLEFSDNQLEKWAKLALNDLDYPTELTLRFVDADNIQELNNLYRQQNKPTNVLAFPSHIPDEVELAETFLGDIVICPAVLANEVESLPATLEAHWAHIIIHGVLHLLGFDHIKDDETERMQSREIHLLESLGFSNPYHEDIERE